jgi:hypothetical protein
MRIPISIQLITLMRIHADWYPGIHYTGSMTFWAFLSISNGNVDLIKDELDHFILFSKGTLNVQANVM